MIPLSLKGCLRPYLTRLLTVLLQSPTLDMTRILSFSVKVNFVDEIFYNFYELEIRLKDY